MTPKPMTHNRIANVLAAACAALLAAVAVAPAAAAFPDRPIRMICPMPAGSAADALTRIISARMAETLGQPVVVENKTGADGAIAAEFVAKSAPDGYTLFLGTNSPMAAVPALRNPPPYDALNDFTPISFVGKYTMFLVVNTQVPVKSVNELVELARSKPGKLNAGTGTTGGLINTAQFKSLGKVDLLQVPYKGEPPGVVDLVAGRLDVMFATPTTAMAHIKDGKLRPLGVVLDNRSPLLPDVPTMAEAGLPKFVNVTWAAILGPARMPKDVVARLNVAVNEALNNPQVREKLYVQAIEINGSTPEWLGAFMKDQIEVWGRIGREIGMKLE
ncbi:MAG: tripartite tricarboxylate transporter substrate binding protein [Burkholderiales bacterium]